MKYKYDQKHMRDRQTNSWREVHRETHKETYGERYTRDKLPDGEICTERQRDR